MTQSQDALDNFGLHIHCELDAKALCGVNGPVQESKVHCGENGCLAQRILNGSIFDLLSSERICLLNNANNMFAQHKAPHVYRPDAHTKLRATVNGAVCGEHCPSLPQSQRHIFVEYNEPEE